MNIKAQNERIMKFTDNKPLIGAVITGIFYLLLFSVAFDLKSGYLFIIIYFPGITFPLVTSYFNTQHLKNRIISICGHFIFSILLYFGCVILFLLDVTTGISFVPAGLIGSLVYLTASKNLYKGINEKHFFVAVVLSGVAFLPAAMLYYKPLLSFLGNMSGVFCMAFGVCAWTVINGYVLNIAYKKSISSES